MDYLELGELLSRVLKESNLFHIISNYTYLRRKGELYVGRCPFHDDKGESLTVNDEEKKFYCSSCHAGGSIFKFIAMSRGCTLREAVKLQAKNVGVSLFGDKKTFEDEKIERKRRELIELNEYAQDFYQEILSEKQEGESCRKYLESRGISNTAAKKFGIGFAPVSDKNIMLYLDSCGFSNELTLQSGLVTLEGNVLVDQFQDCIVVPIKDEGKVVGLVGQIFNFEKKLFYETDGISARFILPKVGNVLDDCDLILWREESLTAIIESVRVLIVDDPLTAISLKIAGIEDVVTILDNKLTKYQVEFLAEYARELIFCLRDGEYLRLYDDTLDAAVYEGARIFVVALPKTPADFLRDEGVENFRRQLENLQPCEFYRNFVTIENETVPKNDQINISELIKKSNEAVETPAKNWAEEIVLRVCRYNYTLVEYVMNMFIVDNFSKLHQDIFRYFEICHNEDKFPDDEGAKKFLHEAAYNELMRILKQDEDQREDDIKAFDEAVNLLTDKTLLNVYLQTKKGLFEDWATSDTNLTKLNQIYERRQAI